MFQVCILIDSFALGELDGFRQNLTDEVVGRDRDVVGTDSPVMTALTTL